MIKWLKLPFKKLMSTIIPNITKNQQKMVNFQLNLLIVEES